MTHSAAGPISLVASPLRLAKSPPSYRRAPPLLGEHTDEVLHSELNLEEGQIRSLREQGII